MPQDLQLLAEAERRGILPPDKAPLLAEARRRGLVPNARGTEQASAAPLPDSQPQVNQASMGGGMLSGALETVKNIPGSAGQFLSDVTAPIHSPV